MKFSSAFQEFYDTTFDKEPINKSLEQHLAKKLFKQSTNYSMTIKNVLLRGSLATFALLSIIVTIAPKAFAETVQSVSDNLISVVDTGVNMITFTSDDFQITPTEQTFRLPEQALEGDASVVYEFTADEKHNIQTFTTTDITTGLPLEKWVTNDNGAHWEKVTK